MQADAVTLRKVLAWKVIMYRHKHNKVGRRETQARRGGAMRGEASKFRERGSNAGMANNDLRVWLTHCALLVDRVGIAFRLL